MPRKRTPSIRVLVVDDHRTFAEALAIAVGQEKGISVRVASDGATALDRLDRERPDVILMDVEMPGMDGIEAIRRIRERRPQSRVVVLSAHDEDLVRARALEVGAEGFVAKTSPMRDVAAVVRRAHEGRRLIDEEEARRLIRILHHRRHQDSTQRQRINRLTPRQVEILQHMADGLSTSEIALHLGMSPFTVRTHVQNILTRLCVHSKLEAVSMAIRHGKVRTRT